MNLKQVFGLSKGIKIGDVVINQGGVSTYTISGIVYDADGSTPVEGATVTLGAMSAISAANGTYTISDIPPGTSGSMTCTKTGYQWTAITVAEMTGNLTAQNYRNVWWAGGGSAAKCLAAYAAKGAASLAASYVNLANPGTNDLTLGTAPAFDADAGWTFNGVTSSRYLKTGITPVNNSQGVIVRYSGVDNSGERYPFGEFAANVASMIRVYSTSVTYTNGAAAISVAPVLDAGVVGISGNKAYRNGYAETGTLTDWGAGTPVEYYIGCRHYATGNDGWFVGSIQYIAFYDEPPTADQMQIITAGMMYPNYIPDGYIFPIGDSLTVGTGDEVTGTGYPSLLVDDMITLTGGYWAERPARYATGGYTVANTKAGIDAALAARADTPTHVLIYLGVNDVTSEDWATTTEAGWKADYNYILDALHAKWANAKIYLGKSYTTAAEPLAALATLSDWIDDLVAARAYCYAGIDGRDIFPGHPEWMVDQTHHNHAGYTAMAAAWAAVLNA